MKKLIHEEMYMAQISKLCLQMSHQYLVKL